MQIRDCFCAYPGSVHDARVFRNSPLKNLLSATPNRYHILADSAYPLEIGVLTPYRDNGSLSPMQKKYNKIHSSIRVVVERFFGIWKAKFRRMWYLDMHLLRKVPLVICSSCVLYSIVRKHEGLADDECELALEDASAALSSTLDESSHPQGYQKRDDIAASLF